MESVSVLLKHDFEKVRKYSSQKKDFQKGDTETFSRRIYLHIYFNATRQTEEKTAFEHTLIELKSLIEGGTPVEELSESAQRKVKKYLTIRCLLKTDYSPSEVFSVLSRQAALIYPDSLITSELVKRMNDIYNHFRIKCPEEIPFIPTEDDCNRM